MTKKLLKLTQNQIDPGMLVVLVVVSPSGPLVPFSSKYVMFRSFLVMANCLEWAASWESWVMVATPLEWVAFWEPCTKTHGAGAGYPGGVCGSSNPVNDVGVTGAGPGGVFGLAGVWGIMFRTLNDSSYPGGGVIGDSSPPSDVGVIGINS